MSDPLFPIPEVRNHTVSHISVDNYGDTWDMADTIPVKIAMADPVALLRRQDAIRDKIRADLDALGIRDQVEETEITLEDGTKATVSLLPPGAANVLQFDVPGMEEVSVVVQEPHGLSLKDKIRSFFQGLFGRNR